MPPEISDLRAEVPRRLVSLSAYNVKASTGSLSDPTALEYELLSIAEEEGFDVTVSRPAVDTGSTSADRSVLWPWAIAGSALLVLFTDSHGCT